MKIMSEETEKLLQEYNDELDKMIAHIEKLKIDPETIRLNDINTALERFDARKYSAGGRAALKRLHDEYTRDLAEAVERTGKC